MFIVLPLPSAIPVLEKFINRWARLTCAVKHSHRGEALGLFCSLVYPQCSTNVCWTNMNDMILMQNTGMYKVLWTFKSREKSSGREAWGLLQGSAHIWVGLEGAVGPWQAEMRGRAFPAAETTGPKPWPTCGGHIIDTWAGWRLGCDAQVGVNI